MSAKIPKKMPTQYSGKRKVKEKAESSQIGDLGKRLSKILKLQFF
jgi:muconolactone delta-isomerase